MMRKRSTVARVRRCHRLPALPAAESGNFPYEGVKADFTELGAGTAGNAIRLLPPASIITRAFSGRRPHADARRPRGALRRAAPATPGPIATRPLVIGVRLPADRLFRSVTNGLQRAVNARTPKALRRPPCGSRQGSLGPYVRPAFFGVGAVSLARRARRPSCRAA